MKLDFSNKETVLVRVILAVALIIAAVSFLSNSNLTGFVSSENRTNSLPVWAGNDSWEIGKNSVLVIDLNNFFSDADNDGLTYLATSADKIDVSVQDNLLTITPVADFVGERTIAILASDEFDAIRVNVRIIVGTDEERALGPAEEPIITEQIVEENITIEQNSSNISQPEVLNATVSSENVSPETEENKTVKTFDVNEKIKDENNKDVGKKLVDETAFETFFTSIEKNESGMLVVFYHNSSSIQPVWIEGDVNYTLSSTVAAPLQNISLFVPRIEGIIPKFKLHVGMTSDVFEFGKVVPDVLFDGSSELIDRDDEKIDVLLSSGDASVEIRGAYDVPAITARVSEVNVEQLRTDVFAAESMPMDNATISLPKKGSVNAVMECPEFNLITNSCPSSWINADIPFTDNGTHIVFTVSHFSGYAGAELNILTVQSYPVVGGRWVVEFNTTGTANLTISAAPGTSWSNSTDDNDLKFLSVACGDAVVDYQWIDNSVFIENYNCSAISKETSRVLTTGHHTVIFTFGNNTKYAYNLATGEWAVEYDRKSQNDAATGIDLSTYDNLTVAGYSYNSGVTDYDFVVVQYNSTGHHLWNATFNSTGKINETASDVAVDSADNIIVVGTIINNTVTSNSSILIVKFDSFGTHIWNRSLRFGIFDVGIVVDTDSANNVIIGGYGIDPNYGEGESGTIWHVVKFDSDGTQLWNLSYKPNLLNGMNDLKVDSAGNIIVSASSIVIKFNSAGNHLWNVTDEAGSYTEDRIAISTDDNIIHGKDRNNTRDANLTKYDPNGISLWSKEIGNIWIDAMALDSEKNIIVAGGYAGIWFVYKFSGDDGTHLANRTYYSGGYVQDMITDSEKDVIVTGYTGSTELGTTDWLTVKFNSSIVINATNTPPALVSIVLNSTSLIYTNTDNLTCYVNATDAENTTLTILWRWINNGVETYTGSTVINNGTLTLIDTINEANIDSGDNWTCSVAVSDGQETGITELSASQAIMPLCGETLSQGSTEYFLLRDATTSSTCFTLGANNITLDCKGYAIRGDQSATDYAIYSVNANYGKNFTMRNCAVYNFTYPLYYYFGDARIYNNTFIDQYDYSYFQGYDYNKIFNNSFINQRYSAGYALYFPSSGNEIHDNYFFNNSGSDLMFNGGTLDRVWNNTIDVNNKNKSTVYVASSTTIAFENNTIINQGTGTSSWGYQVQNKQTPLTFTGLNTVNGVNASDFYKYNQNDLVFDGISRGSPIDQHVLSLGMLNLYSCNNIILKNNRFENHSATAITMYTVNNMTFVNNTLNSSGTYGIDSYYTYNLTFENNSIYNMVYLPAMVNLIAINNTFRAPTQSGLYAISLLPSNNTIYNNYFDGGTGAVYGLALISGGSGSTSDNTWLFNNLAANSGTGIYVGAQTTTRHLGLDMYNNTIVNSSVGIYAVNYFSNITNNTVYNCGGTDDNYRGIYLYPGTISNITFNNVTNCGVGIKLFDSLGYASGYNIGGNILNNNSLWGISITGLVTAYRNNISSDNLINGRPPYYYYNIPIESFENMTLNFSKGVSSGLITLVDQQNVKIRNNSFSSNGTSSSNGMSSGIGLAGTIGGIHIEGNLFNSTDYGIVHTPSGLFANSTIANNTFVNITNHVIALGTSTGGYTESYNLTIHNNTFKWITASGKYAIYVLSGTKPEYINITSNKFYNITNGIIFDSFGDHIVIKDNSFENITQTYGAAVYSYAEIINNTFINFPAGSYVTYVEGSYSNVSNNVFRKGGYGTYYAGSSSVNSVIENNQYSNMTNMAILVGSGSSTGMRNNTIRNNFINTTPYGIYWWRTGANNTAYNNSVYSATTAAFYVYPGSTDAYYAPQQIHNNTACYGSGVGVQFFSGFDFNSTKFFNNSFCIRNLNPLNGTFTAQTRFNVSFNATNVYNLTNTTCTLNIDGLDDASNGSVTNNANTTIEMTYGLSPGNHTFIIDCLDTHDNQDVYNSINVEIYSTNTAPNTIQVIVNSTYGTNHTNENITCWANITDAEESAVNAYYNWYNNSVLFSSGNITISVNTQTNISTIDQSMTTTGENWTCEVKGWDGLVNETDWNNASINITNFLPNITQVFINSTWGTNFTEENISCWASVYDIENTSLLVYYNWYNRSKLVSDLSGSIAVASGQLTALSTVYSRNTTIGDNWTCEVRGWDGTDYGLLSNSSNINVTGCGVVRNSMALEESRTTRGTCFNITSSDIALDCNGYSLTSNGTGIGILTQTIERAQILNCNISSFRYGVHLNYTNHSIIKNSTIFNNRYDGIYVSFAHYNNITNSSGLNNTAYGIEIAYSNYSLVINNSFERNDFYALSASRANNFSILSNILRNNSQNGVSFDRVKDSLFEGNIVNLNGWEGIQIDRTNFTVFGNNTVNNNSYDGIYVKTANSDNSFINNTISYNQYYGMWIKTSTRQTVINNTINYNDPAGSWYDGIKCDTCSNHVISDNTLIGNDEAGIKLTTSVNNTVNNNLITNSVQWSGIYILSSSHNNTVSNNKISSTLVAGIDVYNSNNNIFRNNIINTSLLSPFSSHIDGIYLSESHNSSLDNNTIFNNSKCGYYLYKSSNTTINSGELINNSMGGICIDDNSDFNTIANTSISGNSIGVYFFTTSSNYPKNNSLIDLSFTDNAASLYVINSFNNSIKGTVCPSNVIFNQTGVGLINYTESVNFENLTRFRDVINITRNNIWVDSVSAPHLNKSAVLTFEKGASTWNFGNPEPLVNFQGTGSFVFCDECDEISYDSGAVFKYSVSHFTNYSLQESGTNISISKTQSNSTPNNGSVLNYTITIIVEPRRNNATNVTVYETYDLNTTFINSTPLTNNSLTGNNTWYLGNLTNGTVYQINISVLVNASAENETILNNTVNVTFFNISGGSESSLLASLSAVVNASVYVPPVTAPTAASGGGGATRVIYGGVNRSCTESWLCTPMGECIDGRKTRICTDLSNCGTEITKPVTSVACELPKPELPLEEVPVEKVIVVPEIRIEQPVPEGSSLLGRIFSAAGNAVISGFKSLGRIIGSGLIIAKKGLIIAFTAVAGVVLAFALFLVGIPAWVMQNFCFVLMLATYLALILAAVFSIVYFLTRNYYEGMNKYFGISYVLTALAGLFLMANYVICTDLLTPALLAIAGIVGVFVLDTIIAGIIRQGTEYWMRFRAKDAYRQVDRNLGRLEQMNKWLDKSWKREFGGERIVIERPEFDRKPRLLQKLFSRTVGDISRFNESLKRKIESLPVQKKQEENINARFGKELGDISRFNAELKQNIKRFKASEKVEAPAIDLSKIRASADIGRIGQEITARLQKEEFADKKSKAPEELSRAKERRKLLEELEKERARLPRLPVQAKAVSAQRAESGRVSRFNELLKQRIGKLRSSQELNAVDYSNQYRDIERSRMEISGIGREIERRLKENTVPEPAKRQPEKKLPEKSFAHIDRFNESLKSRIAKISLKKTDESKNQNLDSKFEKEFSESSVEQKLKKADEIIRKASDPVEQRLKKAGEIIQEAQQKREKQAFRESIDWRKKLRREESIVKAFTAGRAARKDSEIVSQERSAAKALDRVDKFNERLKKKLSALRK